MGPGSHLKHIFAWFMVNATPECPCEKLATQMDEWGPDGCEEHLEEILDSIEQEADRRGIRMPLRRFGIRRFVKIAIHKARRGK